MGLFDKIFGKKTLCLSARCADCIGKNAQMLKQYPVQNAVSR